jgi:hypothetical protein
MPKRALATRQGPHSLPVCSSPHLPCALGEAHELVDSDHEIRIHVLDTILSLHMIMVVKIHIHNLDMLSYRPFSISQPMGMVNMDVLLLLRPCSTATLACDEDLEADAGNMCCLAGCFIFSSEPPSKHFSVKPVVVKMFCIRCSQRSFLIQLWMLTDPITFVMHEGIIHSDEHCKKRLVLTLACIIPYC